MTPSSRDATALRILHRIVVTGFAALLFVTGGSTWFALHQLRELKTIADADAEYRSLIELRADLHSMASFPEAGLPGTDNERHLRDRLSFERGRFASLAGSAAMAKAPRLSSWLHGASGSEIDGRHLYRLVDAMVSELDGLIAERSKGIREQHGDVTLMLQVYFASVIVLIVFIVITAGALLLYNYRRSLLPLNRLAHRLSALNRNIPESVHDAASAASELLAENGTSSEVRYVTESVAGLCRDIEEKNRKLDELYILDEKTRLFNYRHFKEHLITEVERMKSVGAQVSLAMIDIDHFKNFNDNYGHIAADGVLSRIADIIRNECRTTDIPARFGGEEFAVLLPHTGGEQAYEVADRLRLAISRQPFDYDRHQPEGGLTVSIGIATCPDDSLDWYSLMNMADLGLYAAKTKGRNRVVSYASIRDDNRV